VAAKGRIRNVLKPNSWMNLDVIELLDDA